MSKTADSFADFLQGKGPLTPGIICDFGLDGGVAFGKIDPSTLQAYADGWQMGHFNREDLIKASTCGPELTELVQRHPDHKKTVIRTVLDSW